MGEIGGEGNGYMPGLGVGTPAGLRERGQEEVEAEKTGGGEIK